MIHLLGIAAAALTGFPAQVQGPPTSAGETWREGVAVERIEPPKHDFYSKRVLYRDIPIEAHADVADEALFVAGDRLDRMLRRAPRLVENLVAEGAELHVIGRDQQTSDLPEHRHWKGKPYDGDMTIDERTRGVGGIHASCGEENLLGLEGDRYWDRDICTHEFAHTVHRYGLSDDVQAKVLATFRASRAAGLWEDAYAGTNDDEYFAELTMWYLGSRGDYGSIEPRPKPGSEWLKGYDFEGYELVDGIYSGRTKIGRRVRIELRPVEVEGLVSGGAGPATSIQFVNRTSARLSLSWIDPNGERKQYGTVLPGAVWIQQTFVGHAWVLTDADGRDVSAWMPAKQPGRAILRGAN